MNKIGNIIYSDALVNHKKVEYINYIDFNDADFNFDGNLPTLFVGWEFLKSIRTITSETILNKEIEKDLIYWEFSFDEKRAEHISGIDMFVRNAPYFYFRTNYTYKNIDPIFYNMNTIQDLTILPNNPEAAYNFKDEMLYILDSNTIYGLDLNMYAFFNMDKTSMINILIENISNYHYDIDGLISQEYYKIFPFFEDLKRYMVVLLSKA